MDMQKLENAFKGKTSCNGGLNLSDIVLIAHTYGIDTLGKTRDDLLTELYYKVKEPDTKPNSWNYIYKHFAIKDKRIKTWCLDVVGLMPTLNWQSAEEYHVWSVDKLDKDEYIPISPKIGLTKHIGNEPKKYLLEDVTAVKDSICKSLSNSECIVNTACEFFHDKCVDKTSLKVFVPGEQVMSSTTNTIYVNIMVGRYKRKYIFNIFYDPVNIAIIVLFKWGSEASIYDGKIDGDIINIIGVIDHTVQGIKKQYKLDHIPIIIGGFSFGAIVSQAIALYFSITTTNNIGTEELHIISMGADHVYTPHHRDYIMSEYNGRYLSFGVAVVNQDGFVDGLDVHLLPPEFKQLPKEPHRAHMNSILLLTSLKSNFSFLGLIPLQQAFIQCKLPCEKYHPSILHSYDLYRRLITLIVD